MDEVQVPMTIVTYRVVLPDDGRSYGEDSEAMAMDAAIRVPGARVYKLTYRLMAREDVTEQAGKWR